MYYMIMRLFLYKEMQIIKELLPLNDLYKQYYVLTKARPTHLADSYVHFLT